MDSFTLFLDVDDPKRFRLFWISQVVLSILWIFQGSYSLNTQGSQWFNWVQFIGGIMLLVAIACHVFTLKKFGRKRLIFGDEALEAKVKDFGHAQKIPWREMARIHVGTHDIEVIPKSAQRKALKIPLGSYTLNRQAKQTFQEYATKKGVEIG